MPSISTPYACAESSALVPPPRPPSGCGNCAQWGGRSGTNRNIPGTAGAKVAGTFELTAAQVIYAVVGQSGDAMTSGVDTGNTGGGGGGGTFLWHNSTVGNEDELLLAAGGGGGADYSYQNSNRQAQPGQASTVAAAGSYNALGAGWPGGNASGTGGDSTGAPSTSGAPGAGW